MREVGRDVIRDDGRDVIFEAGRDDFWRLFVAEARGVFDIGRGVTSFPLLDKFKRRSRSSVSSSRAAAEVGRLLNSVRLLRADFCAFREEVCSESLFSTLDVAADFEVVTSLPLSLTTRSETAESCERYIVI